MNIFPVISDYILLHLSNLIPGISRCILINFHIWATSWQNQQNGMCAQQRLRSAWASAQSDQSSLCAQWVAKDPSFFSCRQLTLPRLIWVIAGLTCHLLVLSWGGSFLLRFEGLESVKTEFYTSHETPCIKNGYHIEDTRDVYMGSRKWGEGGSSH